MQDTYDFLLFIGRFQPFHSGHLHVVRSALAQARRLILFCGSARQPRNTRNPWPMSMVEAMVRGSLSDDESARLELVALVDDPYNEQAWVRSIQAAVADIASRYQVSQPSIALVGLSKNGERYYPKRFPQWPSVEVSDDNGVRGSAIRQALFGGDDAPQAAAIGYLASAAAEQALPDAVRSQLLAYCDQPAFQQIHQQAAFIARYRSAWAEVPYPPTFVTVDGLVVQSGHILLVQRRSQPGKGLWALPGGFVRGAETLEDACIRELREETRLKVPEPVLRGSIQDRRVFDAPFRSERGRTITHVFRIQFTPNLALPKVRGGDDARHALWVPLSELKPEVMFEDHYFIVKTMIG